MVFVTVAACAALGVVANRFVQLCRPRRRRPAQLSNEPVVTKQAAVRSHPIHVADVAVPVPMAKLSIITSMAIPIHMPVNSGSSPGSPSTPTSCDLGSPVLSVVDTEIGSPRTPGSGSVTAVPATRSPLDPGSGVPSLADTDVSSPMVPGSEDRVADTPGSICLVQAPAKRVTAGAVTRPAVTRMLFRLLDTSFKGCAARDDLCPFVLALIRQPDPAHTMELLHHERLRVLAAGPDKRGSFITDDPDVLGLTVLFVLWCLCTVEKEECYDQAILYLEHFLSPNNNLGTRCPGVSLRELAVTTHLLSVLTTSTGDLALRARLVAAVAAMRRLTYLTRLPERLHGLGFVGLPDSVWQQVEDKWVMDGAVLSLAATKAVMC